MSQLVVLNLGKGNWQQGFPTVIAQLWETESPTPIQFTGSLPPDLELAQCYKSWRSLYEALGNRLSWPRRNIDVAIEFDEGDVTHVSEAEFRDLSQQLENQLNTWLNAEQFRKIERRLRTELIQSQEIRMIIETEDDQLRRLPWHLWSFFTDYPLAEVALSTQEYERVKTLPKKNTGQVRILAILGNSQGIEIDQDRALLEQLPATEIVFLVEPQRRELDRWLWAEQGWDILFFAGHSSSQVDWATAEIEINRTDRLTIPQLKNALRAAIARGLQLAIFNSCDGLGLARKLADLQIPQLIVMRESIPDLVAQEFLKQFLVTFAGGKSLYLTVREARERLQGLEDEFPCASWLPVICQNPAAVPPTWQELCMGLERRESSRDDLVTMVFTDLVNSTAIKKALEGTDLNARNRLYLDTILKPHRQRVEASLPAYRGRPVKTEGDAYFLIFANAVQAVQWSVAVQMSHATEPITTPLGPLQVRMGMHTGSPLHEGEDFIGQEVDCAARFSALANGGQILLSEVTAVLVRSANLADLTLYSHGDRYLKGIGNVPIFELLYADKSPQSLRESPQLVPEKKRPMASFWHRYRTVFTLSMAVTAVLMGVRLMGGLQAMELWAFDRLLRLRPAQRPDNRLLVIKVTEEDIQKLGQYPLSDAVILDVLTKLEAYQPRAIGLDIYRDVPVEPGHKDFASYLRHNQHLVTTCEVGQPEAANPDKIGVPPAPDSPEEKRSFSDFSIDPDGIIRRHLFHLNPSASPCQTTYSLSAELAFRYLEPEGINPETAQGNLKLGNTVFQPLENHTGFYHNIDARGHQVLLNYRSSDNVAPEVTLTQVLNHNLDGDWLKDRLVLIGVTAPSVKDYFPTPYGTRPEQQMPGVIIHAQMVSHFLSVALGERPLLRFWLQWVDAIWIWLWSLAGGLIVRFFRSPLYRRLALGAALGILLSICFVFIIAGVCVPLIPPILALMAMWVLAPRPRVGEGHSYQDGEI